MREQYDKALAPSPYNTSMQGEGVMTLIWSSRMRFSKFVSSAYLFGEIIF